MESEAKRYEISYLVSPKVAEDDVVRVAGIVTRVIEEARGVVGHINEPKKRRLFYPIKGERFAYFGYTTFRMDPAAVAEIGKKLKFEKDVMRHLVVEEVVIPPRQFAFRASWQPTQVTTGIKRESPRREDLPALTPEERAKSIETIDKKLDEILNA